MGQTVGAGRVLVVDDDRATLRLIGSLLVREGFGVHAANDGTRALHIADVVRPDLILLDLHMPGMDGFGVCERLKSNPATTSIPVLFLTGETDQAAMVRGLALGAVDYVTKPFEPGVLFARVRNHLLLGRLTASLRDEVAVRTAELSTLNAALQRLAADLSLAEESARRTLADGLHDGVIQNLALARMRLASEPGGGAGSAPELGTILDAAIADLRDLMFDLSPPELHASGLEAALTALVERNGRRFGIALEFRPAGPLDPLPPDRAVLAYQGVHELVTNLIKHSGAAAGLIAAERDDERLRVLVIDDGCGPGPQYRGGGFGLFSLRQRLEGLGGSLTLSPRAPGTCATLILPLGWGAITATRRSEP